MKSLFNGVVTSLFTPEQTPTTHTQSLQKTKKPSVASINIEGQNRMSSSDRPAAKSSYESTRKAVAGSGYG